VPKKAPTAAEAKAEGEVLRLERQGNEVRMREREAQDSEREAQNQRIGELEATHEAEREAQQHEEQGLHEKCFAQTGEPC